MRSIFKKAAAIAVITGSPLIAFSQHYYVVVGAFATEENASEIKTFLPEQLVDTSLTVNDQEELLQLYVVETNDKESAISKSLMLKKEMESIDDLSSAAEPDVSAGSGSSGTSSASAAAGAVPPKPVGKYFKFDIQSPEGSSLTGKVHHVDFEKGKELGAYNSGSFVDLLRPGEGVKPMAVVCDMFGYKEVYKYIDYNDPSLTDQEAYVDSQGTWVIPYKLERVEKGDVSIMNNVSFYKDAAIMRPSSKTDLDELVRMMHTNPYYEITIHAHCNGKNKRDITAPSTTKNYFDVEGSVTVPGTAKDLTALRAEAVRGYLADNGIDPSRMKTFSWGASDMLVRGTNPMADLNDRIEIEFTRD